MKLRSLGEIKGSSNRDVCWKIQPIVKGHIRVYPLSITRLVIFQIYIWDTRYRMVGFKRHVALAVLAHNIQILGAKIRQKELKRQKRRKHAEKDRYSLAA